MFAVVKTGGKQYRVTKDDIVIVEKIAGEQGDMVALDNVLMIGEEGKAPTVGAPRVEKATVFAEVIEQGRGNKVIVFKKKRRQHYRRKNGHRQDQTVLRVVEVSPTGTKPKTAAKKKPAPAKAGKAEAKAPAKKGSAKPAARKAVAKKVDAEKAPARKAAAKPTAKKTSVKKAPPKKAAARKTEDKTEE